MKYLLLALAAIMLLTATGRGEVLAPGEQAHASVAHHRRTARNNQEGHRHRRHHRWHHRKHRAA